MGHMLHARARTTPEVRREIQHSQESLLTLAERYGVNPKTIQKWKTRDFAHDAPMGPKVIRSTSLSQLEEAAVVAFRVFTQVPLDDCLYSLQDSIPHLTRSSVHRCLQRHGVSRLPREKTENEKKKCTSYPIGYFHVERAEVQTEEGKLHLFIAIDRTSKFAYAELRPTSHEERKKHLHAFLMACNLASRLKILKGKSPCDCIKAAWTTEPERCIANPTHCNMGLNTLSISMTSGWNGPTTGINRSVGPRYHGRVLAMH